MKIMLISKLNQLYTDDLIDFWDNEYDDEWNLI